MDKVKHAERLLNDPLIREFFDQLHRQVYSGLKKAKTAESREELATFGRYADEFEAFLQAYLVTGELEDLQNREIERRAQAEADRMALIREKYNW